jgi:hypothetical protein
MILVIEVEQCLFFGGRVGIFRRLFGREDVEVANTILIYQFEALILFFSFLCTVSCKYLCSYSMKKELMSGTINRFIAERRIFDAHL